MATQPSGGHFGTTTLDDMRRANMGAPAADPSPDIFQSISLGNQRAHAQEDYGLNRVDWESRALNEVRDALRARGYAIPRRPNSIIGQEIGVDDLRWGTRGGATFGGEDYARAVDSLWEMWRREQARDPNFMPHQRDIRDTASFIQYVARQRQEELARIDARSAGGSSVGSLIGQIGRGFTDPTSYIPVGGATQSVNIGRQILQGAGREAAANMALTVATEPLVRDDARSLGIDRTAGDFLTDLTVSGVTGGVIGGVPGVAEALKPLPHRVAREIRGAQIDPSAATDLALTHQVTGTLGAHIMPMERDAAHVVARDAEVRAVSPFEPSPEGDDLHYAWLDRALAQMHGDAPAPVTGPRPVARQAIIDGTADSAALRRPRWEAVKARIHRNEASPGNDYNAATGALGPYQFLESTWVALYRRRYPRETGRTNAEIAALRRNPALNEQLMNDALGAYEQVLRRNGFAPDAGNLYLSHFFGPDDAVNMLRQPQAPLRDILRQRHSEAFVNRLFAQNPNLNRGMTGGDAAALTRNAMGGAPARAASGGGGARFATRVDAIVHLGRQLESQGLIVGENRHVGNGSFTPGVHQTGQAHGEYMLDVNDRSMPPGSPQIEARNPQVRERFDRLALEAQAAGYRVLWNEQIYEPHGRGPSRRIPGADSDSRQHRNHIHFEAPQSLVGGEARELAGGTGADGATGDATASAMPDEVDVAGGPTATDLRGMLDMGDGVDRPMLRADHFGSPEEHAQAQLAFERERDRREGFAEVRDEGDLPFYEIDHLDALRGHVAAERSLRPEAVAEALGITPEQARSVTQLLAASRDGNVTIDKNGVARRIAAPEQGPQSLLEFLAARGGIEDVRGDYKAMNAELWHRAEVGRRRLIRERSANAVKGQAESIPHGEDMAFAAAIEHGYFPEFDGLKDMIDGIGAGNYDALPDLNIFRAAVDRELRGAPLYRPEDVQPRELAPGQADEELLARLDEAFAARGVTPEPAMLADAVDRVDAGAGIDKAVAEALAAGDPARAAEAEATAALDPEAKGFEQPDGPGAKAQSESLEHDIRMLALTDEELGAFRFDEDGDAESVKAMLAELDEQAKANQAMRACMAPPAMEVPF